MTNTEKEEFILHALEKVYFYIESNFWSKPNMEELNNWFSNFNSIEERYCAARLLDRFVYYSEEDIIRLLEYGIFEKIFKRKMLQIELETKFKSTNDSLVKLKSKFLNDLRIVPLYENNQSESSLAMLRYLTNNIGIPENRILDMSNLSSEDFKNCSNLIIIDDFIGSGSQIQKFWNYKKVKFDNQEILFNELKDKLINVEIEYLCLVCTEEGYENFKYDFQIGNRNDLRITYCEILKNKFKVFSKDSIYFDNHEIEDCKDIIQELCNKNNIDVFGYQGLDYAIAFHHSIPDCSLPIFFVENENWNYLFRNKKTSIYE